MAKILKTERALQSVSSLTLVSPVAPPPAFEPSEADRLREELEARNVEIERLRGEIERVRKDARETGLAEGRAQGRADADRSVETLTNNIAESRKAIAAQIQALEPIALAIAANALERVIGPLANQSELVAQIVKKQIAALRSEARLEIEVAASDFSSAAALDALKSAFKGQNAEFRANSALSSGECRVQLRLGALDVGPAQQWAALTDGLSRMGRLGAK